MVTLFLFLSECRTSRREVEEGEGGGGGGGERNKEKKPIPPSPSSTSRRLVLHSDFGSLPHHVHAPVSGCLRMKYTRTYKINFVESCNM